MKIIIDEKILKKNKISFSKLLFLLSIKYPINDEEIKELINEGYISNKYEQGVKLDNKFFIMPCSDLLIDKIFLESEKNKSEINDLQALAEKLIDIFPQGKKPGGSYHWRSNKQEVCNKLNSFFQKFERYDDELIIEATKKYVKSFEHDRTYMHLLKYFIWKIDKGELKSELANWIENNDNVEEEDVKLTRLV